MTIGGIFGGESFGAWASALLRRVARPRGAEYTGLSFEPRRFVEAA
jgi:hypothetical protein